MLIFESENAFFYKSVHLANDIDIIARSEKDIRLTFRIISHSTEMRVHIITKTKLSMW